jgi:hypothetical protein
MKRREYLKHKKSDLEELPKKLSMRNSAKYGNCNRRPSICHDSCDKLKMMYHRINKFIKSRVGKSYDEVYSEFRNKFPEYFAGVNLVDDFKNHFEKYQDCHYNWRDHNYYVDDNGLIQDGYNKPIKPKTVKINIRSKVIEYSFTDYVFEDKRLLDIITTYLPRNYYKYLIKGVSFSERVHDSIKSYLIKKHVLEALTLLYSDKWFTSKDWYYCVESIYKWTGSHYVKTGTAINSAGIELLVFKKNIIEDCDIVEIKSKAFKRSIQDNLKTQKSIRRNREKQKELEREYLLHDLLQERKKKEKEENELIRDRHGFDDHSFKNW